MVCNCSVVEDGEGKSVVKRCAIHEAGPELVRVLSQLVSAIHDRDHAKDFVVSRQGMTLDEIYERSLTDAQRVLGPLAALYFERPRGVRYLRDARNPRPGHDRRRIEMACKYCDENRRTNDEGVCSDCEPREGPVDRGLEEGRLPVIRAHGFGPIEGVSSEHGHSCAVCGDQIAEADHPVHRDYRNPRINFRGDLHFHIRCGNVWRQRAMRE